MLVNNLVKGKGRFFGLSAPTAAATNVPLPPAKRAKETSGLLDDQWR